MAHLHPPTNVPTKYQHPTSYSFQDIARISMKKVTTARSSKGHTMMLHTYTLNQCPYQVSTSNMLWFLRYRADKIFKLKVTMVRSKIKSRSCHDIAHLHPQPMSLSISNSYTLRFLKYSPDKLFPATHPPNHLKAHDDVAHLGTMGQNNTRTALKAVG